MERRSSEYVPESLVAACAATAMMLVYSAPTPGTGSRYLDGRVAHESKALSVLPVTDALAWSGRRGVGETVLDATSLRSLWPAMPILEQPGTWPR